MKRTLGIALIALAAISLLASAAGLIGIWTMRQPISDAAVGGMGLFAETLDTTSDALQVTSESLESASAMVATVERTALTATRTLSTTRTTIGLFATMMGKDLPTSIGSARTALQSAQASALIVDTVLVALSRLPLFGIQYNPAVPLNAALGDVAKSLDNLPPTFGTIERNLNSTGDDLDQIVKSLNELPRTTQEAQRDIANAQKVVARYRSEVDGLRKVISPIKASLETVFTVTALGLTFLILWLSVTQLQVLLKGLELLRGDYKDKERA